MTDADELLRAARTAAAEVRRERPTVIERLSRWLGSRRALKAKDRANANCRNGKHDFRGWEAIKTSYIYSNGSTGGLPMGTRTNYRARCANCKIPTTIKQDSWQ